LLLIVAALPSAALVGMAKRQQTNASGVRSSLPPCAVYTSARYIAGLLMAPDGALWAT